MPSIDKLRHNIRHAVSLSAFSPNLIHRIRYFFSLYSYFPRLLFIRDTPYFYTLDIISDYIEKKLLSQAIPSFFLDKYNPN